MNYRLIIVFVATLLLPAYTAWAQNVSELCRKADEYSAALQVNQARQAIEQAYALEPSSYDVLWRMSRIYSEYGETLQEGQQEATYNKAKEYAEKAVQANSQGTEGYLRRAIALGKLALFKGVFSVGGLVKAAHEDVKKAISLNNAGQKSLALAHYVLGRMHFKLTEKPKLIRIPLGLGFGNMDDALTNLKKARDLRSGFIMFHLDYARALIEEERYDEAQRELQQIPSMQIQAPNDDRRKEESKVLLRDLAGK